MFSSTLDVSDQTFLEKWKRLWLQGSFLAYIAKGSEPIGNIVGNINRGRQWGMSNFEMQRLLETALSKAYRPDYSRYEELSQLLKK